MVIFIWQIIFTAYLRLTCPCHLWPFCQGDNQTKRVTFDSLRFGYFRMLMFSSLHLPIYFCITDVILMCTTVSLPHKTMPTAIWRLSLIENATICASYKYPTTADKENCRSAEGRRRRLQIQTQEMDGFSCHLFLTAREVIGHLRGYEVFQQTIFILVFSQLKHMEERLRI